MLLLYGAGFLFVERYNRSRKPRVNSIAALRWSDALLIGVFQVLALIPGTSRSGATILGGIFLAVPVMFGASLLKIVKFGAISGTELGVLLVGMAVAFGVSILAIRFLMGYIRKHDFTAFGWYRIGLGLLVLLYFYVIR